MDAYFDMFSGISGNMVLGALVDLGLDLKELESELDSLGLSEEYKITSDRVTKEGISGTYVDVELIETRAHDHDDVHGHNPEHSHEHTHEQHHLKSGHGHHHEDIEDGHNHNCNHNHKHNHPHHHGRNLSEINKIIEESSLSNSVKEKSKEIFLNLAGAEAKIHNTDIEKIHFHEVGAVDAIVDIVGSVIGMELLGIERVFASKIHTGTGFIQCQHGKMPLPAPATMELLSGVPIYSSGIENELVTPTGAAIITTLAENFTSRPEMKIEATGYGAGSRELEIPNLLRINIGNINSGDFKKKSTILTV